MAFVVPTHLKIKLPHLQQHNALDEVFAVGTTRAVRRHTSRPKVFFSTNHQFHHYNPLNPKSSSSRTIRTRVSSDGVNPPRQSQSPSTDTEALRSSSSSFSDSYVPLFVRMLGLDNDPLDREQAIIALWKYSLGGKQCVENIMQFHGCLNLTVNLLKSESSAACEAAAGLLRTVSSINSYRGSVAESGAIEEITGLLTRSSLTTEVKEQSICTLWNLSVDEDFRMKIANAEILPLLIKSLDDDDIKVKEAVGGVLANLSLSHSNHSIMVEEGVIPKLAKVLTADIEGSKIIRKEARNALLELAKDDYYKILVIEEGLVLVPMIGAAAYKSFRPVSHSWPSLPDGTELERRPKGPSKYGAAELLLGLNIDDNDISIEETKMKAIIGRTQQQFLARIGAIEMEDGRKLESESSTSQRFLLLPWMDGVARLVLILGLEEESAISRAAESIADASINEHMRISFKEAGAIKHLVQLLDHKNDAVKLAVIRALERLSISNDVFRVIEAEGAICPLVNTLKNPDISESLMEKTLNVLARILDPVKEMKSKFYDGSVNGSRKGLERRSSANGGTKLAGDTDVVSIDVPISRRDALDSSVATRLVEILKTSSPSLQRKAASILEFLTITELSAETIISADIESGLDAVLHQKTLEDMESERDGQQPELYEVEEAGYAISAASRLLTKLLDLEQFRKSINLTQLARHLRKILMSNIPLQNKEWVAASLVKLSSFSNPSVGSSENPINMEVTLYETIPRLVEQMKTSFDAETQETAAIELNRIFSEGIVDSTRAFAANGGIFPLVKLIEEGTERAVEAGLAILYNLSMDIENHSAIVAAGAVPILRRYILSQRPQWMRALRLLRSLPA